MATEPREPFEALIGRNRARLWRLARSYLVVTLVFGWWIVHINRRAVREYLAPLRDELVRILGEES